MFAQRLKELRARDKLSQAELAKLLNVAAGTVGMWETGERNPDNKGTGSKTRLYSWGSRSILPKRTYIEC